MTDEMIKNDATRYFILVLPDGHEATLINEPFNNEGDARKRAEALALDNPGTDYAVYEKTGTVHAQLACDWKGKAR